MIACRSPKLGVVLKSWFFEVVQLSIAREPAHAAVEMLIAMSICGRFDTRKFCQEGAPPPAGALSWTPCLSPRRSRRVSVSRIRTHGVCCRCRRLGACLHPRHVEVGRRALRDLRDGASV